MSDYEQTEAVPISPGFLLQEARKKLNLTVSEIAIRLLLKEAVVIGLENDDYGATLSPTFIKGYLRSYAKLVELDPEDIIAAYNDISGIDIQQKSRMQSFSRKISRDTYDSRWMYVTYGIISVVIILIGLYAWQNSGNSLVEVTANTNSSIVSTNEQEQTSTGVTQSAPVLPTNQAETAEQAEQEPFTRIEQRPNVATSANVSIGPENTARQATTVNNDSIPEFVEVENDRNITTVLAALENADPDVSSSEVLASATDNPTNLTGNDTLNDAQQNTLLNIVRENVQSTIENDVLSDTVELVFTFEQDCWIKITDATGEDIAYGVKKAGRVMPVSGQAPFSVILGAPKGVAITFAGSDVDISAFPTNATARFTLPLQETL
ncbi:RodZ domain-containing protein [Opacimonas viscosa]|uniref:DUF4115 domain-containing protein n=1 Tax=Opacimonas viscosa TaxID=2961944 RepID=A0AA41X2Z1_9ALTE|nr:RodZ domain-containing protein [Opacimonas viscosa]MCP3428548.1 DUF4115 domain-containing protein [Opacimonas viscosa]